MREKVQGFESVIKEDPELPESIEEAINLFAIRGDMGVDDQQTLLELNEMQDKHVLACWEAFKVIKKMDDLLNNLQILVQVKSKAKQQPAKPVQ